MATTILVADDTAAIVDALRLMLELAGYLVETTGNGSEVISIMQEKQPDLVLLDVWLGGRDGRILCRQIKQQETLRHIPLLLMSAHRDLQQMSELAGANGYLLKPFTMKGLLSTIAIALQQQAKIDH
ncbi:MAG TPA: response regulator [Ktedonosporobacter sp.]|nr:response regulator [Ktedonosporobacter sp.]